NGGDVIRLKDASGRLIKEIRFGAAEGGAGQSLNRDPDGDGSAFVPHRTISDEDRSFSPGSRASGRPFTTKPRVSSIRPSGVRAASGSFSLTILGTDFLPGAGVLFGARPLAAVVKSDTELVAEIGGDLILEPGSVEVQVRNPRGELSSEERFLVVGDAPKVISLSPDSAGTMAQGFVVTVIGEHFEQRAVVLVNGAATESSFESDRKLSAKLLDSVLLKAGRLEIEVLNDDGNRSNAVGLPVRNGPLITRISRSRLSAG